MIPINELRIGNYIRFEGNIKKISFISNGSFFSAQPVVGFSGDQLNENAVYDEADVQEVSLTTDILKKCGFVFHEYFRFWQLIDLSSDHRSELDMDSDYNILDFMRRPIVKNVASLHQLQNIYFALKGRELFFQQNTLVRSQPPVEAVL